jgi:hypothetical protein
VSITGHHFPSASLSLSLSLSSHAAAAAAAIFCTLLTAFFSVFLAVLVMGTGEVDGRALSESEQH